MKTTQGVANLFALLGLTVPPAARLQRIAQDDRSYEEVRDDLLEYMANQGGFSVDQALRNVLRRTFAQFGVDISTLRESEATRLGRLAQEILDGTRTLGEVVQSIRAEAPEDAGETETPKPPGAGSAGGGTPKPDPKTNPGAQQPIDWKARVRALYPWLPAPLIAMFADEWADTGDQQLALATVRASDEYEQYFPGIKRDDGSLRMTEQEWFSTREAYGRLFQEFGLNDQLFTDRFTELMTGDVSPSELAGRLGAAYERIVGNIDEVKSTYSQWFGEGGMSDAAIFASFIDPDIGDAILNRRVSVAQVGGEGLARGFDVSQGFAERLVGGGVSQEVARNLFVQAEGQLNTLDQLVKRHRDPDDSFDLEEFAEANVFGDAAQTRRIRRVLRAEAALFSDQAGSVAVGDDLAITGLTAR